jgi:hypothetical protein
MKKLIDFKTLNSICAYRYPHYIDTRYECENEKNVGIQCSSKVCPIWKKLKEVKEKEFVIKKNIKISSPYSEVNNL